MAVEKTKQARATGQIRKQGAIIPREPTPKGAIAFACQRIEQSQRDDFARIETGLTVFRQIADLIIHLAEQFCDTIYCGHGNGSSLVA